MIRWRNWRLRSSRGAEKICPGSPCSRITPASRKQTRFAMSRTTPLVRGDHHRHACLRQLTDHLQHLGDEPSVTFRSTLMYGNRLKAWKTIPIPRRTLTRPRSRSRRRPTRRSAPRRSARADSRSGARSTCRSLRAPTRQTTSCSTTFRWIALVVPSCAPRVKFFSPATDFAFVIAVPFLRSRAPSQRRR
jgi:hypothetical protein